MVSKSENSPSIELNKKLVLFDGVCNLCNGAIQFMIKHDKEDTFLYAALQSDIGKKLIAERNIDTEKVDSILLIEPGVAYYDKSDAALQIGKQLRGYRTISSILYLIPSGLRNIVYDFIARNRYNWYGKREACMIPTAELKAKFLD
ncbi:Predicted thiol-disulfide oxidoreductase YuxK, DCC family [Pricia antarctica]|uniref:Predicted thiol-disulfide oxidoreductase YuxK, DCC family n=1 Tax=Pricia antarctica TaxID=641691 RepID=A0A1G7BSE5_9FLAO|nr:DCC1-like thiol-disulfide oxidoreductase family protein [Pricia antarctica]SDE29903.1 Predicted thiol-disulfide oxidoreductase YuxK, DCC family [Pricia antarctica]